eukprot:7385166-Alexandrium_andersonii.AAC.1
MTNGPTPLWMGRNCRLLASRHEVKLHVAGPGLEAEGGLAKGRAYGLEWHCLLYTSDAADDM